MGSGLPNFGGVGASTVPLKVVSPLPGQVTRRVHSPVQGVPGAPPTGPPSGTLKPKSASWVPPVRPPVSPDPPLPPVGLSPPPPFPPTGEMLFLVQPSAAATTSGARRRSRVELWGFTE